MEGASRPPAAGRGHSERQPIRQLRPILRSRAQRDKQVRANKNGSAGDRCHRGAHTCLPGLTDTCDGAGGDQPAANESHGAVSRSPAQVQSEAAQDDDHVEW
jgi:hypothetical protein